MAGRTAWIVIGLLLAGAHPAAAHDVSAAELARLNALVTQALDSGWVGMLALLASGVALGALHGLEPGHAKTMMSAFIIAIRGTVGQAVLLGAAATASHTAVVWLLVVPVMAYGGALDLARSEPYFQIASAAAVLAVAGWTLLRVLRAGRGGVAGRRLAAAAAETAPGPTHEPTHVIDTGHGLVRLQLETVDGRQHFVARGVARSGRPIALHADVGVETRRPDGVRESFAFAERDGVAVSTAPVAAPHRFVATLRIAHGDHGHAFAVAFAPPGATPLAAPAADAAYADAHERAHAEDLERRLASGRRMTTWQVVLFGLSGGLLPCPAAVTVLLLCLHLKRVGLGLLLVGGFSLGLALTMIAAGTAAALGARRLRRFGGLAALARPATYASCALIVGIGLYLLVEGIDALA
jgi:nickel/cobalt exporter